MMHASSVVFWNILGANSITTTIILVVGDALSSRKEVTSDAHDRRAYQAQSNSQSDAAHVRLTISLANHMSSCRLCQQSIRDCCLSEH